MELLINFNSGESLKLLLRFDSNSFFSLSTFPIRSTCYTSFYTFTRWKTYNNFLLNRTVASFPDSIVVGSNFPSDKLFLELWHSIHGAESCESYYPKKEHARKAKLSSNIYAFLSTSVLLRHDPGLRMQIIKGKKSASPVCKQRTVVNKNIIPRINHMSTWTYTYIHNLLINFSIYFRDQNKSYLSWFESRKRSKIQNLGSIHNLLSLSLHPSLKRQKSL